MPLPVAVVATPSVTDTSNTPVQDSQVSIEKRPAWILPAILVTSAFMVLVIIILAVRSVAGKKSRKTGRNSENVSPVDNDTEK